MAKLISADKRIADIKKLYCDGCDNRCGAKCFDCWVDDAMCLIDDAPSVDAVEVVHGHWIKEIDNSTHMHKCSVCGARAVKGLYEYDNPTDQGCFGGGGGRVRLPLRRLYCQIRPHGTA